MLITDPQLKSNDGGISSIKTVFNIHQKNISRKYIEQNVPLEEKGSRISDIKKFLNSNGFKANFKLLDVNHINGNVNSIKELFPFILPIHTKKGLQYVVINGLKVLLSRLSMLRLANIKHRVIKSVELQLHLPARMAVLVRTHLLQKLVKLEI